MKHLVSSIMLYVMVTSVWVTKCEGQSLFVPGGVNYVDIGDLDVAGNQITVEAIITQTGNGTNIVSKHTGPGNVNYLMRPGSAEITTTNGYINAVTGFPLVNGQCYHLAFTYNGTSLDYYVNGCLASSTPHTGNLITNDFTTGIGDMSNCQCESWVGYIDEVRIWNVARTQAEIQANMTNLPNPTTQPGLLAYYQFNGNFANAQGNPTWNGNTIGNPQIQANAACQNVDLSFQNQITSTDVSCNGGTDGTVTVTSSGGHPNYTYSPDGVNYFPINIIGNLPPGNATIWASSGANSGCIEQIPVTILEPSEITTSITGTNPNCVGGNDGTADLTVNGGTPPYTFNWSSGSTQEDPTNLIAGNNTVAITDANGCTATENIVLNNPTAITTSITGSDPSCYQGNDGVADLTVNNGTPPYSFNWSSGSNQQDPTNLTAGNNTVTITDANGCTANESIVLGEPTPVLPNAFSNYVSDVSACDGGGTANPTGGTPPYTYLWDNGQTTQTATGMCVGVHSVTVTDANGCTGFQNITVNVPACLTDVDFYTWQQAGQPVNGNWVVQNAGAQVTQTVNGGPTFFVTPVDYINVRMRGKMRTTDGDDDMMGVVFGFNDPLGASDNFDMWLFDWKQGQQTFSGFTAQEGFALSHAVGTITDYWPTFWGHTNTPEFTTIATNYGNNGWNQNIDYEVEVTYTVNRAIILVDGDTIFDVYDCFEPGRFGFYNFSQQQVIYSDFTYELFADFVVEETQICAGDTAHFTFLEQCGNFSNLNQFSELEWDYGDGTTENITNLTLANVNPTHVYQSGGTYQVQLIARDTLGCRDTVLKNIQIFELPTADFTFSNQCLLDQTQLTDVSAQGDFAITDWVWDFDDASTAFMPSLTHQFSTTGLYNVSLVVEDSYGCVDTSEQLVEIYNLPQAGFSPIDDCYSSDYPFTDQSTIANGSVDTWQWDFGDAGSSTNQNPTHTYAGYGQYDVELIAISNQGCRDTISQTIILHDNPVADFVVPNICQSEPMQYLDNSSIQEGAITDWDYDLGDLNTSAIQDPFHTYTDDSNINVTLTVTSNFGCIGTSMIPVVVNPKPTAEMVVLNVCLNEVMNFADASSITTGNVVSWEWDFGDANSSIVQNPTNLYAAAGTYTTELMVESNQGCRDTTQQQVEVYQLPVASFNFANVCLDATATFADASISNSGTIDTWNWNLGDNNTEAVQGPITHEYITPADYVVELIVETDLGCADTLEQTITIYPMPQADFTADSVCFNEATSFTDGSLILTGTINNYAWDFGFGASSTNANPTNVFPETGYLPVFLTVTSDFGCKDTITQQIRVYVLPEPAFTHNDTCFEDNVQFDNQSQIAEGTIDAYYWEFGDANNANLQNPIHGYSAEGLYQTELTATSNYGCTENVTHQVEIYPLPQIAWQALPDEGCQPLTVTFDNQTTVTSGYFLAGYQWDFGHGLTSSSTHPQTLYPDSGLYDIQLIATTTNGCDDTLTVANAIDVWPRPIAGFSTHKEEYLMYFPRVDFIDESTGATQWEWDLADGSGAYSQNPSYEYSEPGNYQVIQRVLNDYGCDDETSERVLVKPAITLYIPNSFTPNEDGINETFSGQGIGLEKYEMWIYNRWGENIFYSASMNDGWDGTFKGKQVESGMYIYKFNIVDVAKEQQQYTGEVYLMR